MNYKSPTVKLKLELQEFNKNQPFANTHKKKKKRDLDITILPVKYFM